VILSAVPLTVVAGDSWRWTRDFADYPAPTWTVTYYFENELKQFSSAATASGTSQAVSIDATTTGAVPPGRYRWFARAVNGSIIETIPNENGWIEVQPDPSKTGTRDLRSWARRALDAVLATLEGKASSGQQTFAIKDRTVSSYTLTELMQLKKELEQQVRIEEKGSSAGLGRKLQIRIGRG
jgi:hypothetical protein